MFFLSVLICASLIQVTISEPKSWKEKDVLEYTDVDFDNLDNEWEENDDEKLPPDELPYGHPDRPRKPLDIDKIRQMKDPKLAVHMGQVGFKKRGFSTSIIYLDRSEKTVIVLVSLTGNPTMEETSEISSLWDIGLSNNHIQASRFPIEDDRIMFTFHSMEMALEAKDFFIEQERCFDVEIEQKVFYGKHVKDKPEGKYPKNKQQAMKNELPSLIEFVNKSVLEPDTGCLSQVYDL